MPQIIVTAADGGVEKTITLRERINASDFESDRFATNLIERIAWAVSDATEAEQYAAGEEREDEPRAVRAPRELVEA